MGLLHSSSSLLSASLTKWYIFSQISSNRFDVIGETHAQIVRTQEFDVFGNDKNRSENLEMLTCEFRLSDHGMQIDKFHLLKLSPENMRSEKLKRLSQMCKILLDICYQPPQAEQMPMDSLPAIDNPPSLRLQTLVDISLIRNGKKEQVQQLSRLIAPDFA